MPRHEPPKGPDSRSIDLPSDLRTEVGRWAVDAYPAEACGILVGSSSGPRSRVERAFLATNLEIERPGTRFQLDPRDHLAAWRWARERDLDIIGFWHSHPDHPAEPSSHDLQGAWEDLSYFIVAVTASGAGEMRSWRLWGGSFEEEAVRSKW